jgi:hypothetical protein
LKAVLDRPPVKKFFDKFHVSTDDIFFLSEKMGLEFDKAANLFEEKFDVDNILFSLSNSKKILLKEMKFLSFYPFCKLLGFYYLKKLDLSFEEKNYLTDIIYHCYPMIRNEEVKVDMSNKKQKELTAGYCLTIIIFFDKILKKINGDSEEVAKIFLEFILESYVEKDKKYITSDLENIVLSLRKMRNRLDKKFEEDHSY